MKACLELLPYCFIEVCIWEKSSVREMSAYTMAKITKPDLKKREGHYLLRHNSMSTPRKTQG